MSVTTSNFKAEEADNNEEIEKQFAVKGTNTPPPRYDSRLIARSRRAHVHILGYPREDARLEAAIDKVR